MCIDTLDLDVVDAEDRAGDLPGDRDETLADLDGCELQRHPWRPVDELQAAPGSRVVVETLGVHQVLHRHAPADSSPHVTYIGRQPGAAGESHRIERVGVDVAGRERERGRLGDAACHRGDALDDLAGDQGVARDHGVAQANGDRVEAAGGGQPIHLAFVGEARLDDSEAAHRPARQVIGAHRVPVDESIGTSIRTLRMGDGVEQDR